MHVMCWDPDGWRWKWETSAFYFIFNFIRYIILLDLVFYSSYSNVTPSNVFSNQKEIRNMITKIEYS